MQTCNKTNTTYANTPDNKQIKCKHARKQTKPTKQTTPIQTCKKTNETIKNPPLTALPAHCLDWSISWLCHWCKVCPHVPILARCPRQLLAFNIRYLVCHQHLRKRRLPQGRHTKVLMLRILHTGPIKSEQLGRSAAEHKQDKNRTKNLTHDLSVGAFVCESYRGTWCQQSITTISMSSIPKGSLHVTHNDVVHVYHMVHVCHNNWIPNPNPYPRFG